MLNYTLSFTGIQINKKQIIYENTITKIESNYQFYYPVGGYFDHTLASTVAKRGIKKSE